MKTIGNHGVIAQIAGRGQVLAALVALVLSSSSIGRAQLKPAQAGPRAASENSAPLAQPAAQTGQLSATSESAARGKHEGIKVHGHWVIDVRNPDGTLVTHHEFENSLTLGAYFGSALLTNTLGRVTAIGGWEILLVANGGNMRIDEPGSTLATACGLGTAPVYLACGPNLSVIAGTTQSPGTLTFTGFVTVPASQTSISQVQSNVTVCPSTVLPSACFNMPATATYSFTQANLSPAITITPGQVVQAAVTINFQ